MADPKPMRIVLYPDPFLNKKARAITPEEIQAGKAGEWDLAELVARMKATMYDAEGVGLAAPQIGVSLRLFVADPSGEDHAQAFEVLNPVLSELEGGVEGEEGCLSIPGVRGNVKRAGKLRLQGVNLKGESIDRVLEEFPAIVVQHENDHLDGVLFLQHLGMAQRFMIRRKLQTLEDEYEVYKRRMKGLQKK